MLPDLCTRCLTPEEAAIDRAYAGIIAGLRVEKRFHACLLAIAQGMAANPSLQIDTCAPRAFVERAFELASALSEAADMDADDDDDDDAPRILQP